MGKILDALLALQGIERQLATVRHKLRTRKHAVSGQEHRIQQMEADFQALHTRAMDRRKDADRLALDLKSREDQVSKFRAGLNAAKTNKDYSAILTQINTLKADNAKFEEQALTIMTDADAAKAQADKVKEQIAAEQKRLEEIRSQSQSEIDRLTAMMNDLSARREAAAKNVSPEALAIFERVGENYDGEAMAPIEIHGKKPPYDYVCGGCFMGLNAEHVNALQVRDEIRTCDNCKRILYLEPVTEKSRP